MARAAAAGLARMALAVLFVVVPPAMAGEPPEKLKIVATLFPQYDFARRIAGERAEVTLLLPPGAESHSFEPTPTDMKAIASAALFVYTGPHMEPWAKRLAEAAERPGGVVIVDASRGIAERPDDEHADHPEPHGAHAEVEHGGGAHIHEFDPHIWLDPRLAQAMADNIADALAKRDPEHAEYYLDNARTLKNEIAALDAAFRDRVAALPGRTLVFGERFAFGYFFDRYGLEEIGPYKSCAPGVEPGMKAVIDTVKYIKENGVKYIYAEAMETPRIAAAVRRETGVDILVVDSLHNPPAERQAAGAGYVDIMRDNMDAFARGLE